MEKLIKLFPLLPQPKQTGKLIGSIIFYAFVPGIVVVPVAAIIGFLLGITIILAALAPVTGFVIGLAGTAYSICGIVFAIMKYLGKEI